jgi:hypothetical protein
LLAYSVYPEAVNCDTDEAASYNHQSENVQQPDLHSCSPFARELQAELGVAASSSYLVKRFPPELYYHLVEHCSLRTISKLCCLSSTIRAIVSPVLYKTMIVSSPDQLSPFSGNDDDVSVFVSGVNSTMLEHRPPGFLFLPLSALLSQNPLALTLDRVLTLHLSIRRGDHLLHHTVELDTYPIIPLPNLRHLQLISSHENHFFDFDRSNPDQFQDLCDFELAQDLLSQLNPSTLTLSRPYFDILLCDWGPFQVSQQAWRKITSSWTRLASISFVDCPWILLHDTESGETPLSPLNLPQQCRSLALSWTFTDLSKTHSYFEMPSLLRHQTDVLVSVEYGVWEWPSVEELVIEVVLENPGAGRGALMVGLEQLPEESSDLVRYRYR